MKYHRPGYAIVLLLSVAVCCGTPTEPPPQPVEPQPPEPSQVEPQPVEPQPVEPLPPEPPLVEPEPEPPRDEWTFEATGGTEAAAIRAARGEARKTVHDRVESWADRAWPRASQKFRLRNSPGFSSHFSRASDAMLQGLALDVRVAAGAGGQSLATVTLDSLELRDRFRDYLQEAATFVVPGDRAAYDQWCSTLVLR